MHNEAVRLENEAKLLLAAADLLDKPPEIPKAVQPMQPLKDAA
jgi:hypothetical protein